MSKEANTALLKKLDRDYWLCFILAVANLLLSIYAKKELNSQVVAIFFLFLGVLLFVGAWANSVVYKQLEKLEEPPEDDKYDF